MFNVIKHNIIHKKCIGYRIQAKWMEVIWTMKDLKLVDISGKKDELYEDKIETDSEKSIEIFKT